MNNRNLFVFLLISLLVAPLYSQQKVTIAVFDAQGKALSYPEIILGAYVHRVGTEKGTLEIPLQLFNTGDTLTVKYLGYKTSKTLIDDALRSANAIKVKMEEDSFLLDPIVVRPSDFSGERYFQQKIKDALVPYTRKYFFDADFTFKDDRQDEETYTGHLSGHLRRMIVTIYESSVEISEQPKEISELLTLLKRATEVSYLIANAFCDEEERSYFYCTYKGESSSGLETWEFSIKRQEKMPWNLERDDELRCMVSLDKNGLIKNIKTQRMSSSNHSFSYLLDTEFTLFEAQLVPLKVKIDLVPNADNDVKPLSLVVDYTNVRRKK